MSKIETLQAELKTLAERAAKRRAEAKADQEREFEIGRQIRRLELEQLVGKPNAVRPRFRMPAGDKGAHLNDVCGTLKKIRRTKCTVDFAGTMWDWPIEELAPADRPQGTTILNFKKR